MPNEKRTDDVFDLWQSQETDGFRMTPEEIRKKMDALDAKLRKRNKSFYLACVSLMAMFTLWFFASKNAIQRTGAALTVAGVAYLGYQVRRNQFRAAPAEVTGTMTSVDHLRRELERQRDFHRGKTFWKRVLIFTPGPLVFFVGFAKAYPEILNMIRFEAISFVIIGLAAIPLNLWMARRYQRQIDELDTMRKETR